MTPTDNTQNAQEHLMTIDVDKLEQELKDQELHLSQDQWMSVVVSLKRASVTDHIPDNRKKVPTSASQNTHLDKGPGFTHHDDTNCCKCPCRGGHE